jgi:cbb3-type cytochrome oxidase subunit 3
MVGGGGFFVGLVALGAGGAWPVVWFVGVLLAMVWYVFGPEPRRVAVDEPQ